MSKLTKIILTIVSVILLFLIFLFIKSIFLDFETPPIDQDKQQEVITFLKELEDEKTSAFNKMGVNLPDWKEKYVHFIGSPEDKYYVEVSAKEGIVVAYDKNNKILSREFSPLEMRGAGLPAIYNDVAYFINSGCVSVENGTDCTADQYLEQSNDNGKSWQKSSLPRHTKETYFIIHDDTLYHIYSSWCGNNGLGGNNIIPALSFDCGEIYIRSLNNDKWTEPYKILSTADSLLGVYSYNGSLMLFWRDTRYNVANWCGFIPAIGCFDGEPTRGPYVMYLGEYDVDSEILNEYVIQNEYNKELKLY